MVRPINYEVLCVNKHEILGFDPHVYTSGRWLRDDKRQRQIRQIDLDFDNICQKIVDLSDGAKSIKHCEKKGRGF